MKPIFLIILLSGCAIKPPSLFEVTSFCDNEVQTYKARTKDESIDIECKS